MNTPTKTELLDALHNFIESRPGFDPHNYGSYRDLRADQRRATRQLHDARAMLTYVACRDSITADMLLANLIRDRLTWDYSRNQLDYTTGQYYPTEYRGGACRVLVATICRWLHDANCKDVRAAARRELGRSIAARYFV